VVFTITIDLSWAGARSSAAAMFTVEMLGSQFGPPLPFP
jgi:hypothetical protein